MGTAVVAEELPDADELEELYRLDASEPEPEGEDEDDGDGDGDDEDDEEKTTATGNSSLAKCRTSE